MSEAPPCPAYRIVTDRLILRCWDLADAPLLKAAVDGSVGHLRDWLPWARDEPQSLDQKLALLRRFRARFDLGEDFAYGLFDPGGAQVLGGCGLHRRFWPGTLEIGYWVHVDHGAKGLGTEAAAALTRVGFEVERVRVLEIRCDPTNAASVAIPRKLGYTHEGTLRARLPRGDDEWRDVMVWTLLATDYPGSPAARARAEAFDPLGRRIL